MLRGAAALSVEEHYFPGELVHRQGDRCEGLRFLKEGTAKLSRIAPDGREQVLRLIGPWVPFDDVPLLDGGPCLSTVTVMKPATVVTIPKAHASDLILGNTDARLRTLRLLASRLRGLNGLASDLNHLGVEGRLAKVIHTFATNTGSSHFSVGQQDLASMVGTTRAVAARALRDLEDKGAISRGHGEIRVIDDEKLLAEVTISIR